jgi:hypothetical protein
MNSIKVFNPEHDMALANGDRHFIAPRNIREMACDLAPLLKFIEGDEILVWGWDHAIKTRLLRMGIAEGELPTDAALTALRACSERQSAHQLLRAFHADHPEGPYIGESILAHSLDDIAAYATQHGHVILKDPLSSSGKGLRHVNLNEDENEDENRHQDSSPSIKKIKNWAEALLHRHGYLTAEPYYDKVQDFAMEFFIRDGQCRFIGYSLFNTNPHGRYESNLLMEDEKIEALLAQHIPNSALHEVRDWVIIHSHHIIPVEWDTTRHPLYFGIDMMVVKNSRQFTIDKVAIEREQRLLAGSAECSNFNEVNSQLTIQDPEIKNQKSEIVLHPCVEINLRLNMGIIAHEVRRRLLAPGVEGRFHVAAFPSEEAAQQFHREHTEKYPPVYREGKMVSGYHPLTPILPHTRHHAYVICG